MLERYSQTDLFRNGTRAMYKAVKPIARINGVQDIISRIGQRFAAQGAPEDGADPREHGFRRAVIQR